jgi:hypothetical protein
MFCQNVRSVWWARENVMSADLAITWKEGVVLREVCR